MSPIFQKITNRTEWDVLVALRSPFFDSAWEEVLSEAFPYIRFEHFRYRDAFAVRVARIGERVTTVPFSDGGDVIACADTSLSLSRFRDDCIEHFGGACTLRVHEGFCPVTDTEDTPANLMDYRVALPNFGIESVRKTLRHLLSMGLSQNVSIRTAEAHRDMKDAYRLYLKTMRAARAFAIPFSTFSRFSKNDVFLLCEGDAVHAVSVFVPGKGTAQYFISASDRRGKKLHAPHHLLFHALTEYQKRGFQSVFLGGVRAGSSLQTFKEGWRGTPHALYTITGVSAHEKARRSPLRALWRLIPLSLLPKASKLVGKYAL